MKHKIPLLLVFTIILTHSLHGQTVVTASGTRHWNGDGVVVDLTGCFHGGPFGSNDDNAFAPSIGPTVCGDVFWYADTAVQGDGGQYSTTTNVNISIGVGGKVSVSAGVGAAATYTFKITPLAKPGYAQLTLERSNTYQVIAGWGGATTLLLGYINQANLGKLFNGADQEIDPCTRQPKGGSATNTGSPSGGSGSGGSGGGGATSGSSDYGLDVCNLGGDGSTTYGVFDSSGNPVGQVTYNANGTVVTSVYRQGLTVAQLRALVRRYRGEG